MNDLICLNCIISIESNVLDIKTSCASFLMSWLILKRIQQNNVLMKLIFEIKRKEKKSHVENDPVAEAFNNTKANHHDL